MPTPSGHTTAIRASRVIGTSVHDASGDEIGKVEDVVLDKVSDRIMFAVISLGGALVATDNYYTLPWADLDFNQDLDGYLVPYSKDELAERPADPMLSELTKDDGAGPRAAASRR